MRAHLSRWTCLDIDSNLERLRREALAAADAGSRIVVFPELFLTGYRRQLEPEVARQHFTEISSQAPETLFIPGSLSEQGVNRCSAWSRGAELAAYDKVHLFHPNNEHLLWAPGDRYVAFEWQGIRIGLITCNDIRFPEQARLLRLEAGCELLVAVAWWPWRRDHIWRTLLQARAAENGVWTLGCCISGSVWPDEPFAGAGNYVFDPRGEQVMTADDQTFELGLESPLPAIVDPLRAPRALTRVALVRAENAQNPEDHDLR